MKTTIELSDALFTDAKSLAEQERTTLRALIESGLRMVLENRKQSRPFHLRKASYRGQGLQQDLIEGKWEHIRELAYEGRGG